MKIIIYLLCWALQAPSISHANGFNNEIVVGSSNHSQSWPRSRSIRSVREINSDENSDETNDESGPRGQYDEMENSRKSSSNRNSPPSKKKSVSSKSVKIYEHWWFGKSGIIKMKSGTKTKQCVNLPRSLDNTITSIDTLNNCVIVFIDNNCQGRGARLEKYSFGTDDLGRIGMNDQVSSMRPC